MKKIIQLSLFDGNTLNNFASAVSPKMESALRISRQGNTPWTDFM